MITGFNTDVKHGDTVYHVQTEDKGLKNPLILSLIYVKGTILDAFRIRYQDFLASDRFSEPLLQKILEFQHRQIVGAIKRGKYQKGMLLEDYVEGDFIFPLTSVPEPTAQRKPDNAVPVAQAAPQAPPVPVEVPETALRFVWRARRISWLGSRLICSCTFKPNKDACGLRMCKSSLSSSARPSRLDCMQERRIGLDICG
jgi:hypothetical protein